MKERFTVFQRKNRNLLPGRSRSEKAEQFEDAGRGGGEANLSREERSASATGNQSADCARVSPSKPFTSPLAVDLKEDNCREKVQK